MTPTPANRRAATPACASAVVSGRRGEALGRLVEDAATLGSRFDGYSSQEATAAKILRDVFEPGDAWFRTGDLMRRDAQNYFYFVDRAGDTFRRKGENVATAEVAASICAFAGVRHANVYGVAVPGVDGRVGMAAVVADADGELDLAGLRAHLAAALPGYARPLFLRLRQEVEVTGTLKYAKAELVREGYDPHAIADPLYVELPGSASFVPLDPGLYDRIQAGDIRF